MNPYTEQNINKIIDPAIDGFIVEMMKFNPFKQAGNY